MISPILSNLFLHHAFDLRMRRAHPDLPWCRYADDGLVHCRSELEAETLKVELQARLGQAAAWNESHQNQDRYWKDGSAKVGTRTSRLTSSDTSSDHEWSEASEQTNRLQLHTRGQPLAPKAIRSTVRDLNIRHMTQRSLDDIARKLICLTVIGDDGDTQRWRRCSDTSI